MSAAAGSDPPPDLVITGNLLVDDLVFIDGQTRMGQAGGAVLYAALGASLWGARVGCVSLRGADYPAAALRVLGERGVDLAGVRPLPGDGGRTWLLYEGAVRRMVPWLGRPTHAQVSPGPSQVPPAYLRGRAFHLAPMPLPAQQALLDALPAAALRSLDPHLPLSAATLPAWRPLLDRVDVFLPNQDELQLPGVAAEPEQALRGLRGGRLRLILLKQGAHGGLLYDAQADRFTPWSPRPFGPVVDPTGAGDAFAAGFLCGLLAEQPLSAALQQGVATASFALGAWGAAGLLDSTPAQARRRLASLAEPG